MLQYDLKQELIILSGFGKPNFGYLLREIINAKEKLKNLEKKIDLSVVDISKKRDQHDKLLFGSLEAMGDQFGPTILFDDFVIGGGFEDPIDYTEIKDYYKEKGKLDNRLNRLQKLAKNYCNKNFG